MSEIRSNIDFNYYPSASEECRTALLKLGYHSFRIIGYNGSHHADIYFFNDDDLVEYKFVICFHFLNELLYYLFL